MATLLKYNDGYWSSDRNKPLYITQGYLALNYATYNFTAHNPTTVIPVKVEFQSRTYVPSTGVQSVSLSSQTKSLIDSTSDLTWNYSTSTSNRTYYLTLTTSSPTSYYLYNIYGSNKYCGCSSTLQKPDSTHLTVQLSNTQTLTPQTLIPYTITDPGNTNKIFVSEVINSLYTPLNTLPLYVTDTYGNQFEIVLPNGKNTYYNIGRYDATITIPQNTYSMDETIQFQTTINLPGITPYVFSTFPNWTQARPDLRLYQYTSGSWNNV